MAFSWHPWCVRVLVCPGRLLEDVANRCIVPTRLFALKHGATLVWGPEIVDKAILHGTRNVDRESYFDRLAMN